MYKKMSYGSGGDRKAGSTRPRTSQKTKPKKSGDDKKPKEKKARGNNSPKKSDNRNGLKRLTPAQEKKLKEHSDHHSAKHMAKMRMVMTKEGRSFSEAHRIAMRKVGK